MMKLRLMSAIVAVAGLALIATAAGAPQDHHHTVMPSGDTVPGESIYQLQVELTDQNGKHTTLAARRGHPTLITMFYTSCQSLCPVLATTLQRMEGELTPAERARLRVTMISFDPKRDTVQALAKFGKSHGIDGDRWLLGRASGDAVRDIAAALGIRYRPLPDGSFSHSATIILLDADGVIRGRTESLQQLDKQFMQTLHKLLTAG
jgi:protein SCO1/2